MHNVSARLAQLERRLGNRRGPIIVVGLGETVPAGLSPNAVVLIETEEEARTCQ